MTYPAPTHSRRLPYHTDEDMLRLEARSTIHAGMLPANAGHAGTDGLTAGPLSEEAEARGWTAQQPWVHVDCPVDHVCVMCGRTIDPDFIRRHAAECRVVVFLKEL